MDRYRIILAVLVLIILLKATDTEAIEEDDKPSTVQLSGDIGVYGELYSISGRSPRRPGEIGRLFFSPILKIGKVLQLRTNFIISTEGSSARQNINHFNLNPKWSWGELHFGNFTKNFSPLTLNGVSINGAGISLYPGKFRLAIISGQSQRAVTSPSENRVYRRDITGIQFGIGKETGSLFAINVLTTKDDIGSLENISNDTSFTIDSTNSDSVVNPLSITPQENLVISTIGNIFVANRQISLQSEISASAFSRDRQSTEISTVDYPNILTDLFTANVSSSFDYAYRTKLQLSKKRLSLSAGYEYIGPGYQSLGLVSNLSDKQVISFGGNYSFKVGMIKLFYLKQNDNLINQKPFTTNRNRIMGLFNLRISSMWSTNFNTTLSSMDNQNPDSMAMIDNTNITFRNSHTLTLLQNSFINNIFVEYILQNTDEKNKLRLNADFKSHGTTLRLTNSSVKNIILSSSINYIFSRSDTDWNTVKTYIVDTRWFNRVKRYSINFQTVYSTYTDSDLLRLNLRSTYNMTDRISARFSIISTLSNSNIDDNNYNEHSGSVNLTYHFGR